MLRQILATSRPKRQTGVGLIEILIAVLVLSVGFLGMAALQSKALSNNNSAMVRSMATIASYSILDAMRVDVPGRNSGDYDGYSVDTSGGCSDPGNGRLSDVILEDWCEELRQTVGPASKGSITSLGGGNYLITITFDDARASGGQTEQILATQAKL